MPRYSKHSEIFWESKYVSWKRKTVRELKRIYHRRARRNAKGELRNQE